MSSFRFMYGMLIFERLKSHSAKALPVLDIRIRPDYTKSLTDVCVDFMEYCIEKLQSLNIFCQHWAPPPKENRSDLEKFKSAIEEEMPSWIPSIKRHVFGAPGQQADRRSSGDSFVDTLERQSHQYYNT